MALADAAALAAARGSAVSVHFANVVQDGRQLRTDQKAAFAHAIGALRLALIEGRAGTGKSYTLAAIHDAHALAGRRVIGLAPTNTVAQDLAASGFVEAMTVHAALFRLKNGRDAWNGRTVLVVDEAAMLDARITGELLAAAGLAGAKVVLAVADRRPQKQSWPWASVCPSDFQWGGTKCSVSYSNQQPLPSTTPTLRFAPSVCVTCNT